MQAELRGILVAMTTPFTAGGEEVDEHTLVDLTDRLIEARVSGLVPCGSTGEFTSLTPAERRRVTEVVLETTRGRVPVIPHTGAMTTRETVELSKHAEKAGAAGVMVIPPYYERPPWSDLVEHYRAVTSAIDIPLMLYHNPSALGYRLSTSEVAELAQIDGIGSIKDSNSDLSVQTEILYRHGDRIGVFAGLDTYMLYGLAAGARGAVWGAANVMPEMCVELFESIAVRHDLISGRELWARMWPICHFLEQHGYVASVKAGCEILGHPVGPLRLPLRPLSTTAKSQLATLLEAAQVATSSA